MSNGVVFSVQSKSPLKFPASNKLKIGDICSCGSHTVKSPNVFFFFYCFGDQAQSGSVPRVVEVTVRVS